MHNNPMITKQGTLLRIFKTLFSFYPVMMPVVVCCILFSAIISSIPSVFMQKVIAVIEANWQSGDWAAASGQIMGLVGVLVVMYLLALISAFTYTRMMATITQGFLKKLRVKMFSGMQDLPIRYFDTNNHGDIMSYYTNDIDTLRQLVSQSFPQITITLVTMTSVTCIMLVLQPVDDPYCGRQDPLRRHQHQQDQKGRPAPQHGHRAAGYQPVYRHCDGQHPLRQSGCLR